MVDQLASHLARRHPGLRGQTRPNLFRMRQFYETYRGDEKVSALLRQLPWTHNLLILGKSKRAEEREFYLRMSISEKWSKRELERQIAGAWFERVVLSPTKNLTTGETITPRRSTYSSPLSDRRRLRCRFDFRIHALTIDGPAQWFCRCVENGACYFFAWF